MCFLIIKIWKLKLFKRNSTCTSGGSIHVSAFLPSAVAFGRNSTCARKILIYLKFRKNANSNTVAFFSDAMAIHSFLRLYSRPTMYRNGSELLPLEFYRRLDLPLSSAGLSVLVFSPFHPLFRYSDNCFLSPKFLFLSNHYQRRLGSGFHGGCGGSIYEGFPYGFRRRLQSFSSLTFQGEYWNCFFRSSFARKRRTTHHLALSAGPFCPVED